MQFSLTLGSLKWSFKISQTTSFHSPASWCLGHININSQFPDVSIIGTLRRTYLFNNFPCGVARHGDLIMSNVDATPYESQSVIVRKYHIVSIGRRRKEIFGVIFQSARVPTLCTYVSFGRVPRMDNRQGGGRYGKGWRRATEAIFYGYRLLLRETFRTSLKGGVFVVLSVMRDVISGIS